MKKEGKYSNPGFLRLNFPRHIFSRIKTILQYGAAALDWRNSSFDILWNKTGAIKQKPNSSFHTNYVKLLQNCEAGKLIIKVLIIFTDLQFEKQILIILGSDKMTQGTCPKLT